MAAKINTSDYLLGNTDAEHERLIRQAVRLAPVTEGFFREAGIGPGQRVLDLGSGVGDVAMLAARLVGPTGEVVGVERDARSIARAKSRALEAGLQNVRFMECDVTAISSDTSFDAAVGRYILQFLPDVRFGDSSDLADELATQVVVGEKHATTTLLRDFTELGKPMPKPGDFSVVIDGKNSPRCIVQTLHVDVKALRDVDESFARDEGGGDRSLEWWRSAHARYFKRQGAREGFAVDDGTEVILERFEVVWPLGFSDRP
jgi:uncharacterized protein YhfF